MNIVGALICAITSQGQYGGFYGKERNDAAQSGKKKLRGAQQGQAQASGNFGTMIPRDLYEEINEFLAKNHITKVQLIFRGYESLKAEYEKETESKT